MAEFTYYITEEEWWPVFALVLERNLLRYAPDRPYDVPWCDYLAAVATDTRVGTPTVWKVHLVSEAFSESPLYLRRQETGAEAGHYFIDLSRGGPSLQLDMVRHIEEEGVIRIGPAVLSFQKLFWNDSLTEARPAPKELKDAFGGIKRTIQRFLTKRKLATEIWISPQSWRLYEAGKAAILDNGRWFQLTNEGLVSWSNLPSGSSS